VCNFDLGDALITSRERARTHDDGDAFTCSHVPFACTRTLRTTASAGARVSADSPRISLIPWKNAQSGVRAPNPAHLG
jgi:hypothetical protein